MGMAGDEAPIWFYSKGGQQHGPVSQPELQQIISGGELHPAKDMVWKEGLPNWMPLVEAKDYFALGAPAPSSSAPALFGAPGSAAPAQPAASAQPAAPTQPAAPAPESLEQAFEPVDLAELTGGPSAPEWPGASRRPYLIAVIGVPAILGALLGVGTVLFEEDTLQILNSLSGLLILIITIVYTLKRFTNLDMSRWWFLGNFVPLVNLWVGYRCFACPPGYANHGKMDKAGILLAIVYWVSLILLVLGMVWLVLHLMERYANDPEFREEVRKVLIEIREQIEARQ